MAVLAIDRGRKHIGLAVTDQADHGVVFPLGKLMNADVIMYELASIIAQRHVDHIIVGYPSSVAAVQAGVDAFIRELQFVIDPQMTIERVNEDYSSVQAQERHAAVVRDAGYTKTAGEDSLAAAVMLEIWLRKK